MAQGVDNVEPELALRSGCRAKLFSSDERRTTLTNHETRAEYHSRPHDARRFPVDEDDGGTSEESARIIHEDFNCNRRYENQNSLRYSFFAPGSYKGRSTSQARWRRTWTAGGLTAQSVNILFQVCLPPSWARP